MARIKILDLPKDVEMSEEEMKKVTGGACLRTPSTDGVTGALVGSDPLGGIPYAPAVPPRSSEDPK